MESEPRPTEWEEPNFESWISGEEGMHERRRQIVARAAEYGENGWMFAPAFTFGDAKSQEHSIIALTTLVSQGYLAADLDNPRVLRITEAGQAWHQDQVEAIQAAAQANQ